MIKHLFFATIVLATLAACDSGQQTFAGDSWMFRPSYYTHSPVTGERVNQYRPDDPAVAVMDPNYQESGFNYQQYNFNIGGNQSHLHVVQTWGQGASIRPYGEWEYPYRAGATPYGPWGNPQGPWTLPYDSWSNPYAYGRPVGDGVPTPYGPNQNGGQAGQGQFRPQPPQAMNPPGQGAAAPRTQGPVAF